MNEKLIERDFYLKPDVVEVARNLLGKRLVTLIDGKKCSGIICETEAYAGITDKASHAFGGRRTDRTEIMYRIGGTAYVYLCYGVHSLFNVVTSVEDEPHAVLIRGIIPETGEELMAKRKNKLSVKIKDGIGPGNVSKLLGIHYSMSGLDLCKPEADNAIWIEEAGLIPPESEIVTGSRIGVEYAGEDAKLPYRFIWKTELTFKQV